RRRAARFWIPDRRGVPFRCVAQRANDSSPRSFSLAGPHWIESHFSDRRDLDPRLWTRLDSSHPCFWINGVLRRVADDPPTDRRVSFLRRVHAVFVFYRRARAGAPFGGVRDLP